MTAMALHDESFMADAACAGRTELFFGPHPEQARAICRNECPVLIECRRWAESVGDIRRGRAVHGVIGGVAPDERAGPVRRICAWAGCRVICADLRSRYCSEEHVRAARTVSHRAYNARKRVS